MFGKGVHYRNRREVVGNAALYNYIDYTKTKRKSGNVLRKLQARVCFQSCLLDPLKYVCDFT